MCDQNTIKVLMIWYKVMSTWYHDDVPEGWIVLNNIKLSPPIPREMLLESTNHQRNRSKSSKLKDWSSSSLSVFSRLPGAMAAKRQSNQPIWPSCQEKQWHSEIQWESTRRKQLWNGQTYQYSQDNSHQLTPFYTSSCQGRTSTAAASQLRDLWDLPGHRHVVGARLRPWRQRRFEPPHRARPRPGISWPCPAQLDSMGPMGGSHGPTSAEGSKGEAQGEFWAHTHFRGAETGHSVHADWIASVLCGLEQYATGIRDVFFDLFSFALDVF